MARRRAGLPLSMSRLSGTKMRGALAARIVERGGLDASTRTCLPWPGA